MQTNHIIIKKMAKTARTTSRQRRSERRRQLQEDYAVWKARHDAMMERARVEQERKVDVVVEEVVVGACHLAVVVVALVHLL